MPMRFFIIFFTLILFGCGGSLSSEQRKKIRENMEAKSIKKVSEAEITAQALEAGRLLSKVIEQKDRSLVNRKFLDSLEKAQGVEILSMTPTDTFLRGVEKQIIEAYTSGSDLTGVGDNLQKMGPDTLLYTKPLLIERPDGSLEFSKALGIRIPKRQVIRSIKESK